ncbi:MAG: hypothetical protein VW270_16985, partial [Candidatus Poseidoniales archaeon]
DVRLRELERKATTSLKRVEHLEPELDKMEEKYTREKDRLGKVFSIAEELDNDLRLAVAEMSARDTWYMDHMALFEELNKAIKERYDMIERAVDAERKSQHLRTKKNKSKKNQQRKKKAKMSLSPLMKNLKLTKPSKKTKQRKKQVKIQMKQKNLPLGQMEKTLGHPNW